MKRSRLWILSALLFVACGGDDSTGPPPGNGGNNSGKPVVTPVGTPNGVPVTGTIGAGGGSLESSDGLFALTVPPGALTSDTDITIQPMTNTAPGGKGPAYQLTPEGLTFATPVEVTADLGDSLLAGTDTSLVTIVVQRDDGTWAVLDDRSVDWDARTLTCTTTHFSNYAPMAYFEISPGQAVLGVNQSLTIRAKACYTDGKSPDGVTVIVKCYDGWVMNNWSVNGVVGGNATVGSVSDLTGAFTTYTAPAAAPSSNPVAVSVEAVLGIRKNLLVSHITILDQETWEGIAEADYGDGETAVARVTWNPIGELGDMKWFAASGTVEYFIEAAAPCQTLSLVPDNGLIDGAHSGLITIYTADDPPTVDIVFAADSWTAQHCFQCPDAEPGCKDIGIGPAWAIIAWPVDGDRIHGTTTVDGVTYTFDFTRKP